MTTPSNFPIYNGTYNISDTLVAPWFIPGWDAQHITQDSKLALTSGSVVGPGFPSNMAFRNVRGNFFDANGSGLAGFLTVRMSDGITFTNAGNTYHMPARYVGAMDLSFPFAYNNWGNQRLFTRYGFLSINLMATDQPSGSTIICDNGGTLFYWVTEHWLGGRYYQITLPSSTPASSPVDINSLIVPGTILPYKYDPVNPAGDDMTRYDEGAFDPFLSGGTAGSPPSLNSVDGGHG